MHSEPIRDPIIGLADELIEVLAMKYQQRGHFTEMTFEAFLRAVIPSIEDQS